MQPVLALLGDQAIIAVTDQNVVSDPGPDDVVAAQPADDVVAFGAGELGGALCADDRAACSLR